MPWPHQPRPRAAINLTTGGGSTLTILGGKGTDTQTVDFSTGNPIPAGGLTYTGAGGANTLILQGTLPGGPFASETYNATGAGAGNIALDGSTITFTGLKPIVDTTPTINFTFNYTGGLDGRINVGPGATVGGTATTLISSSVRHLAVRAGDVRQQDERLDQHRRGQRRRLGHRLGLAGREQHHDRRPERDQHPEL